MKVMILAAGLGKRMRPLTNDCPKPLLKANNKALIVHHIERLKQAGFTDIIINTSYLADKIHQALGDGSQWEVKITFSYEGESPLETGGGIVKALPFLGKEPFMVINGDIWCEYPLTQKSLKKNTLAHLVLVPNPSHNPQGDFGLENQLINLNNKEKYTFSGIAYYHPEFFTGYAISSFPLAPLLKEATQKQKITGEVYMGKWMDIGTPERLAELDNYLKYK